MDHLAIDRKLTSIYRALGDHKLTSIISDLQAFPVLYAIAYWLDRGGAAIIFADPSHTISWNIATRANAGDPVAIEMCEALDLLSPSHCAWSLQNEALCRIAA